jgi:protein involved in polysaccharide export with SLBB domain
MIFLRKTYCTLFVLFLAFSNNIFSQGLPNTLPKVEEIRQQLKENGINEEEFVKRLGQKGYNLESINPNNTSQVKAVQVAANDVFVQMKAESENKKAKKILENTESTESVKDDGTLKSNTSAKDDGTPKSNTSAKDKGAAILNTETKDKGAPITEKQAKDALKNTIQNTEATKEVADKIKDGATIEQALTEDITKKLNDKLAPAKTYGQQIFRDKNIAIYRQSKDVKPPETYVLGPGDKIGVSIWGYSQESLLFEISPDGFIKPDAMPRIYLKGITLSKAKSLLYSRFSQSYRFRPEEFEITINFARTITVNVVGEVINFGSFNLPATNTAFNALAASGGPSDIGSVRNIVLKRNGKDQRIDVYEFLLNPSVQNNLSLEENDYIYVPVAEKLVTIEGSINRPNRYELLKNESLKNLIFYAAGLPERAIQSNCVVKRIVNDKEEIINVPLAEVMEGKIKFELKNGDVVSISALEKNYENKLSISGAIDFPGEYAVSDNFKLIDLLKKARLNKETSLDLAYIIRTESDNTVSYQKVNLDSVVSNKKDVMLKASDRIIVFNKRDVKEIRAVSIVGAVRKEGKFPFSEELKLRDLIILSNGLQSDATDFAYIERFNVKNENEKQYIRVNIDNALINPNSSDNIKLEPGDRIQTFSNTIYTNTSTVSVEGAVKKPGTFQLGKGITVKDVLVLSQGFVESASPIRVEIFRVLIQENQPTKTIVSSIGFDRNFNQISGDSNFELQPYDLIVVRTVPDFSLQKVVNLTGQVIYPGNYAILKKDETITDLIKRAGGLSQDAFPPGTRIMRKTDEEGTVLIKLEEALLNPKSNSNIVLKEGDEIFIPKTKDLVSIYTVGTRSREFNVQKDDVINVPYFVGKSAKYYIEEYTGGLYADKEVKWKDVYVEYPNGKLKKSMNFLFFKTYPKVDIGSKIKVTLKEVKRVEKPEKAKDPDKLDRLIQRTTMATALVTLIVGLLNALKKP